MAEKFSVTEDKQKFILSHKTTTFQNGVTKLDKISLIIDFDTSKIDEKIKAVIEAKKALDIAISELDEVAMIITTVKSRPENSP